MKTQILGMPPGMTTDDEADPIWVNDFDAEAAKKFANALFAASKKNPGEPILVYINSGGGDVSGLLTMMSAMDSVPNDIITVAMGFAMSAGAFLLAHGSARFASPHARIMVHKVQAGAFGNLDDILNESEMLVNLNGYVLSVFAKDCKKSSAEVEKSLSGTKREVYMDPMQAKAYGMIDHVGVPVVNALGAQQQYQISVLSAETPVEVKTKEAKKKAKK